MFQEFLTLGSEFLRLQDLHLTDHRAELAHESDCDREYLVSLIGIRDIGGDRQLDENGAESYTVRLSEDCVEESFEHLLLFYEQRFGENLCGQWRVALGHAYWRKAGLVFLEDLMQKAS